jgi:hypothetical protein
MTRRRFLSAKRELILLGVKNRRKSSDQRMPSKPNHRLQSPEKNELPKTCW